MCEGRRRRRMRCHLRSQRLAMTFSALRQLLQVLNNAVDTLEAELKPRGLDFPSLDAPYDPGSPVEAALDSDAAAKAIELIVAASAQLCAAVRPPTMTVLETTLLSHLTAVLQFVNRIHVVELLREAGPHGMHVRDMVATADVDEMKLGHCLRLCSTFHVFREVSPDVFANNRISSALDSGKRYDEVVSESNPNYKYTGSNGLAAYLDMMTGFMLPGASQLPAHFTAARTRMSRDPCVTPIGAAHGYEGQDAYSFLESPKNAQIRETFAHAMPASTVWGPPDSVVQGYDWASIEDRGVVVDVGGGLGHIVMPLYERFPHLRFEVQDHPGPCAHGSKVWNARFPRAIASGRMAFRPHDFFDAQPVKDAAVFIIRNVAHNWPDEHLERLLRRLRDAAQPTTRLLVVDHVLPYSCAAPLAHDSIPGARLRAVPEPLLPNLGRASAYAHLLDICMLSFASARERTLDEHIAVASRAGWRIVEVRRVRDNVRFGHVAYAPA